MEGKLLSDDIDIKKTDNTIYLSEDYIIKKPFSFYNLSINGDLIGYIIFEYNKENINKDLENLLLSIIENCLENG